MNPRVFLDGSRLRVGQVVQITGEDGHHWSRVLRVSPGELVALGADGKGYLAKVDSLDTKAGEVDVMVIEQMSAHESPVAIHLVQGLPKADKAEFIVQHGTEVGISGFLFVQTERSVVRLDGKDAKKRQGRIERWQRVIREAAGQSQRDIVPKIEYCANWDEALQQLKEVAPGLILLLDEDEDTQSLYKALTKYAPDFGAGSGAESGGTPARDIRPIVLCVGPEGGWDAGERRLLVDNLGAVPVTLGPRILRTETAGLVGAAAVLYHFHALGG
jgi:16S rRNA (uracil1498-N3)-methyltransferase